MQYAPTEISPIPKQAVSLMITDVLIYPYVVIPSVIYPRVSWKQTISGLSSSTELFEAILPPYLARLVVVKTANGQ